MAEKQLGSSGNRGIRKLRRYLKKENWPFLVAEDSADVTPSCNGQANRFLGSN